MTLGRGNITTDTWWHWYNNNGLAIVSQCYLGPLDLFRLAFERVNASCSGEWTFTESHAPGLCVSHDGVHRILEERWACGEERVFTLSSVVDEPNCLSKYFFQADGCQLITQPHRPNDAEEFHVVLIFLVVLALVSAVTAVLYQKGHCGGVVERCSFGRLFDRWPVWSGHNENDYELTPNKRVTYPPAEEQLNSEVHQYGTI